MPFTKPKNVMMSPGDRLWILFMGFAIGLNFGMQIAFYIVRHK